MSEHVELDRAEKAEKRGKTARKAASGPAKPKQKQKQKQKQKPTATAAPEPTRESTPEAKPKRVTTFARNRERRLQQMVQNFELVSLVCEKHTTGATSKEILRAVKKKFPKVQMLREDPTWLVRWAGLKGWLRFRPPYHDEYRQKIRERYATLQDVEVIPSSEVDVVAREAARMLVGMLRSLGETQETVHVGVAGGHTTRSLMRALAVEMVAPLAGMPRTVHFYALAAGFDPDDPSTNPNAFVTFFDGKLIPTKIQFTGLSAPSIVEHETFAKMKVGFNDIKEAFESAKKLDIVVTSGSTWHEDAVLRKRMIDSDQKVLEELGVVGDVLWRPISRHGPIEAKTHRAFTLIELDQLQSLVRAGKKVLVALAPCGLCGAPKDGLLECILEQKIANYVVVDARSAAQMLGRLSGGLNP